MRIDPVFAALSDPIRRAILSRLAEGPASVADLTASLPVSQPAVSRHLKVLEGAGLIRREVRAQQRISHLEPAALAAAGAWLDGLRATWADRFDRLDDVLDDLQRETPHDPPSDA
ncbi:ArsR family transcriptional regulator [Rhodobacteraceae bacterium CCMM004]|nr:ArsR family transcriptional regulator [Rhodobacteraceae bacterium CCMM004]